MLKLIFATGLIILSISQGKLKESFKPVLAFYLIMSIYFFYHLFIEVFLIYYSGTEIQLEDGSIAELTVSEYWYIPLILAGILYLLPALWFIPKIQKISCSAITLVILSVTPNMAEKLIWNLILVHKIEKVDSPDAP